MSRIKPKSPPPREEIGPRVMCLSRHIRRALNEAVAEQGLFSGQHDIIILLTESPGITLRELSNRLGVSGATASVSVKRMEKSGFITKKPDDKDARIIRLYPTEKAKNAPANIKRKMQELEDVLKANMTQEQALELSDLLEIAIQNMLKRGEEID